MVRRQRRGRDGVRPAEIVLRVDRIVCDLADDAEVVQGVGEVWMVRAERLLLKTGRLEQELLGGGIVTGRSRLFGVFDDRAGSVRFRHPVSRQESESREGSREPRAAHEALWTIVKEGFAEWTVGPASLPRWLQWPSSCPSAIFQHAERTGALTQAP